MKVKLMMICCVVALLGLLQAAVVAEAGWAPTDVEGLAIWLDASDASTM